VQEKSPERAHAILEAMLKAADATEDFDEEEVSPSVRSQLRLQRRALRKFAATYNSHLDSLKAVDLRREQMGPGSWSVKRPDGRVDGWLAGVQSAFLLFDILLFTERGGGISDSSMAATFGHLAGASTGTSNHKDKPGKWDREIPIWDKRATDVLTHSPHLSDRAVYLQIARTERRHDLNAASLSLKPCRQGGSFGRPRA
jgi:hypothetical protein